VPNEIPYRDELALRLPLPVAQLYRRAHNAKSPLERHLTAFSVWEVGLKLLASVAIVEYARQPQTDPRLTQRLQNLSRPSLGHWWEFVRLLTPVLAEEGDPHFIKVRDLVLGRTRDDLPSAAGLDAALRDMIDGQPSARNTVCITELFDRLVQYRNKVLAHAAPGQLRENVHDRMGRALLAGLSEIYERWDVLAGRKLIYIPEVRQVAGNWLIQRLELASEGARRISSLELPRSAAARLPNAEQVHLEMPGEAPDSSRLAASAETPLQPLHPLLLFLPESEEVLFLNARRGKQRAEYLCYTTGRILERPDLGNEQRELLARVLEIEVSPSQSEHWAALSLADEPSPDEPIRAAPRRLGEYELLSELGRGGMGIVYRAWQPSLRRQVALKKLVRTGDAKTESRFQREIRALGRVEHPNLVKIFTSGSDGEHTFYAMELVEGAPLSAVGERLQREVKSAETVDLDSWQSALSTTCEEARKAERSLSESGEDDAFQPPRAEDTVNRSSSQVSDDEAAEERTRAVWKSTYVRKAVELTRQVALAAHALHEVGVVHRDIKPGNIMISQDGSQAVLMDLGLAQLADDQEGRLTRTRQFVGTLRYASPEQVLAVGSIDRRSDIYSLGATLWELLTLRPIFNATEQTPTPELMRRIELEEPERPRKFHPKLSRDLEAIVLKCLEKNPARRYATAHELARDLERWQEGEPVRARPVGDVQRAWRWCRRKPALASALATLLLVVVASLVGLTWLYVNAESQRQLAERRGAGEQAIARFYEDHVLAAARPKGWAGGAGKDVTLKEALDQAAPKIEAAFAGQPTLEAAVRHTLGVTYYYLGQFDAANPHLEKASALRTQHLGREHPDTLMSLHELAMLRWKQARLQDAIPLAREVLDLRQRVLGTDHQDTLFTQLNLGLFLTEDGNLEEAEPVLRKAIDRCLRALGPDHHHTLYGQSDLAVLLETQGKNEEALALNRKTLEGRRRSLGPDHPDTLRSQGNYAWSLDNTGDLHEAETLCQETLKARQRVLGEAHNETFWSLNHLASLLERQGRIDEAEQLRREILKTSERLRGADDTHTLSRIVDLAHFLSHHNKLEEAETLFRQIVAAYRREFGPEHRNTLFALGHLANVLDYQGKLVEAEEAQREILTVQRRIRGPEHPDTLITMSNLALILHNLDRLDDAEKLTRETLEVKRRVHGPEHPLTLITQRNLGMVLDSLGKFDEAEQLYRAELAVERESPGQDPIELTRTMFLLGGILMKSGKDLTEAESLLREGLKIREANLPPGRWRIGSARSALGDCLAQQNKFAEAEPLLLDGYDILAKATDDAPPVQLNDAVDRIVTLYERWDKPEQAETWREKRETAAE
jgi:serine/threonine protein kinase/tetratricopeptide (TPR) repeat protein